jgi:excisionase family DNA binding protein
MTRKRTFAPESVRLLTVQQAAEYVQLTIETIRRACRTGDLRASKIGMAWRIRSTDLDAWLEANSNTHFGVGRRKAS